jgi:hypothetical protein
VREKPLMVIANVPSPLAEHHYVGVDDMRRAGGHTAQGLPDRDLFSVRGPMQIDKNGYFGSPVYVGPVKMS